MTEINSPEVKSEMKYSKFGVVADSTQDAQDAKQALIKTHGFIEIIDKSQPEGIDVIVAVGGDGFMLHTLHNHMEDGIPVYGINRGSIGFLLNEYSIKDLPQRICEASDSKIHPLKMTCYRTDGSTVEALAINEVSVLRTTGQAAKIRIHVDNVAHLDELICDGVLVSTPAGSSAYNYSNGGNILPIGSNLLSVTPISPFRPRRWRGALIKNKAKTTFEVLKSQKRPVKAVADNYEVNDIEKVDIVLDKTRTIHLLFDKGSTLEERMMKEMFEVC